MEIMILTTFRSHFYKWGDKIHQQRKGGPIGLRASGVVAKVVMELWIREMKQRMENAGFEVFLIKKYVDDVLVVCSKTRRGHRLVDGRLERSCESFGHDVREKLCEDQKTLEILIKLANSVMPFLKFTGEASKNTEGIPVLDTTVWIGKHEHPGPLFKGEGDMRPPGETQGDKKQSGVQYRFYKKPMASRINILKRSAMVETTKVSTACAELLRRWKTTSQFCKSETFNRITREYMDDLEGMGYPACWRENILRSAMKGYSRVLRLQDLGLTNRNRPGHSTKLKRRFKKLVEKGSWFKMKQDKEEDRNSPKQSPGVTKNSKNERDFDNVMFVQHTRESRLKKELQAMEDRLGFADRMRYVEKSGPNLADVLVTKDPWKGHCQRDGCMVCKGTPGVCSTKGVVYEFTCVKCQENGKNAKYYGETSRTMFERIQEHKRMIDKMNPDSPMVEHQMEHHDQEEPNFTVKLVKRCVKPPGKTNPGRGHNE